MLKKELCMKCWESIYPGWTELNERIWKEDGILICPLKYIEQGEFNIRKIKDRPPIKCPYYLENIL